MGHIPLPPFSAFSGPRDAKMLCIAEAFGESEAMLRLPLVGSSGQEFWRMLGEAMPMVAPEAHAEAEAAMKYGLAWERKRGGWMHEAGVAFTNVLNLRPPNNKIDGLCEPRAAVGGKDYKLPAISKGKYLRPEYLGELDRLAAEISAVKPNVIVALGNVACWALLHNTGIGGIRGAITMGHALGAQGTKVLPTYHPAAIFRQWAWRPIVIADLMKARREALAPGWTSRIAREVLINPTIEEVEAWTHETISRKCRLLSPDIETEARQITCIGFARSRGEAIVIPFIRKSSPGWSYWGEPWVERRAWECVRKLLEFGNLVGQNFIYDLQYITPLGIQPNFKMGGEDTMLLHHSLFPEMQKSLGFMGSIYSDELSWKLMRKRKADTVKKDE